MKTTVIPAIVAILLLPGCGSFRKHNPNLRPSSIPGSRVSRPVAVWMSDGSLATFQDTVAIRGVHAAAEKIIIDDFESIPDLGVGRGEISVPADPRGYEGEVEWVIEFPKPICEIREGELDRLTVTVHGIIEGKALSKLGDADNIRWADPCVGNNVLTGGKGYSATIGWLRVPLNAKQLVLTGKFKDANGVAKRTKAGLIVRNASFADEDVQRVLEPKVLGKWLRRLCENKQTPAEVRAIRFLNLSALGDECAAVNNPAYKDPAGKKAIPIALNPLNWRSSPRDTLTDHGRAGTVANLLDAGDCLDAKGGNIALDFRYPGGCDRAILRVLE